jgi:zinc D-Ala-D-Ala carboxypeptidase
MLGLSSVQGRIAAIEARFEPGPVPTQAPMETGSTFGGAPTVGATTGAARFDSYFSNALSAAGGSARTPAARLAPGAYGSLQPPAELVGYGNGTVPPGALASIGDGHSLHAPAAQAFRQMESSARMAGIELDIVSSYRDLPTQQRLAHEKGLYSQGGLAATPGTSNHGWGLSVDLTLDSRGQEWMRANAHQFGFVEDVPREPWHWTYRPAT